MVLNRIVAPSLRLQSSLLSCMSVFYLSAARKCSFVFPTGGLGAFPNGQAGTSYFCWDVLYSALRVRQVFIVILCTPFHVFDSYADTWKQINWVCVQILVV